MNFRTKSLPIDHLGQTVEVERIGPTTRKIGNYEHLVIAFTQPPELGFLIVEPIYFMTDPRKGNQDSAGTNLARFCSGNTHPIIGKELLPVIVHREPPSRPSSPAHPSAAR